MFNWNGQKLLVLGATSLCSEIVREAQRYGAYVIAVDYNQNAPAKDIADEALLCDVRDIDTIVAYIKAQNVNGVLTGFTDSLLRPYLEICKRANLPCYINEEQLLFTTNKMEFKACCDRLNIPVIQEYKQINHVTRFPVIVKPVDNSGARGIVVCRNLKELNRGIEYALKWSNEKRIIIEDYIENQEATVFYVFVNGNYYLMGVADRYVTSVKDGFIKLPTGYKFPSKGVDRYKEECDEKFKNLFRSLGIKNGMMFIQGFMDENKKFTPYECGFRLTGSLEYYVFEDVCGYNPMSMMINFALTGSMGEVDKQAIVTAVCERDAFNISCLMRPGRISHIAGIDKLQSQPNVLRAFLSYEEGTELGENMWGKLAQVCLRVLISGNEDDYRRIANFIRNEVKILDEHGESLLINTEILCN